VVVAANHLSNWDPIMVALAINRPVCFMAKSSLFRWRPMRYICTHLNAFPVDQSQGDLHAIRVALSILQQDKMLGIFPEGHRKVGEGELKAKPGVAMLAYKAQAAVLPVACSGTRRTLPIGWFSPLRVTIGPPIKLEPAEGQKANGAFYEASSQEILATIHKLLEP
jgi:1-acyl-sn-glycerol-3-phosphate acyltransferase